MLKDQIQQLETLFYQRRDGIEKLMPMLADDNPDNVILQIYALYLVFFSSLPMINSEKSAVYFDRIAKVQSITAYEQAHLELIKTLNQKQLFKACDLAEALISAYPGDGLSLFQFISTTFSTGQFKRGITVMQSLEEHYQDTMCLANISLFSNIIGDTQQARLYYEKANKIDPNDAYVQHAYLHLCVDDGDEAIKYFESLAPSWPKHAIYFESHNWMHLILYYLREKQFDKVYETYDKFIARKLQLLPFRFNAFIALWHADIVDEKTDLSDRWQALFEVAKTIKDDFIFPYHTIQAILTFAKVGEMDLVHSERARMMDYVLSLPVDSNEKKQWQVYAIPLLEGCLAFVEGEYDKAAALLQEVVKSTEGLGFSEEQRDYFNLTYTFCLK